MIKALFAAVPWLEKVPWRIVSACAGVAILWLAGAMVYHHILLKGEAIADARHGAVVAEAIKKRDEVQKENDALKLQIETERREATSRLAASIDARERTVLMCTLASPKGAGSGLSPAPEPARGRPVAARTDSERRDAEAPVAILDTRAIFAITDRCDQLAIDYAAVHKVLEPH